MKKQHYYISFLIVFTLIQAIFTPIIGDEAYYWMYGNHLDFGYFDHPPMVALLTKLGSSLFPGTLGLRFMSILMAFGTYILTWKLIPSQHKEAPRASWIYLIIITAIPLCNLYSFVNTPDAALLFFTALYLLSFNRFIAYKNFKNSILLGVAAALLMYTKYHGALIILLTFIPNIRVLKSIYFYVAACIGLAIYSPHLLWQYEHDFITFKFHLFDRADRVFAMGNVLAYVGASILVLNPILMGLFFFKKFKTKLRFNLPKHYFFLFFGGLLFFLCSSFRDKIEPHWVYFTSLPLIIFSFIIIIKEHNKKIMIALNTFIILIFMFRIFAMLPIKYPKGKAFLEFHKNQASYFEAIDQLANGLPVVYANSYQKAAKHSFYTNKKAFSSNNTFYRKNQYDLWRHYDSLNNQDVFFVTNYPGKIFDTLDLPFEKDILYSVINKFPMVNNLNVTIEKITAINDQEVIIDFELTNPYNYTINLNAENNALKLGVSIHEGSKRIGIFSMNHDITSIGPKENIRTQGKFRISKKINGTYRFAININPEKMYYIRLGEFKLMDFNN